MLDWLFGEGLLFDWDFSGRLGDFLRCFVLEHFWFFLDLRLSLNWFLSYDLFDYWLFNNWLFRDLGRHFNLSNELFFLGDNELNGMMNFLGNFFNDLFLNLRGGFNNRWSLLDD